VFGHHFLEPEPHTQDTTAHPDDRTHRLAVTRIGVDPHRSSRRHQRRLLHVAGQAAVVVQVGEQALGLDRQHNLAAMVKGQR
jgi:hypothetical protein